MTILCPIDFSHTSPIILKRAIQMAQQYDGKIRLLYVVKKLSNVMAEFYGFDGKSPDWFDEIWEAMCERVERKLATYRESYIPEHIDCEQNVRYGKISEEIVKEAEDSKASCIILTMPTADALAKVPLANRVTQIISAAPCPVFTFHTITETGCFQKILYPVTTHHLPNYFLTTFPLFFNAQKCHIELVRVLPPEASQYAVTKHKKALRSIEKELHHAGFTHTSRAIVMGKNVGAALNDYAVAKNFCLIMMARNVQISHIGIISAVTNYVVTKSRIPVLTMN